MVTAVPTPSPSAAQQSWGPPVVAGYPLDATASVEATLVTPLHRWGPCDPVL